MPAPEAAGAAAAQPVVTPGDLAAGLRRLRLGPGDRLAVHSSLRSFGHVEGDAQAVLDALFATVGPTGTLVMSTYLLGPPEPLTPADLAHGLRWKVRRLAFDDLTTPTGMGVVADTFRRQPGVVRWPHPVHSVSAWGRDADTFCQGFGPLVQAGGQVVLLGVQLDRCSALHLAEARVALPETIRRLLAWPVPAALQAHYPPALWHIGCQGAWGDFLQVQAEAERRGLVRRTQVGAATLRAVDAAAVVDLYAQMLRDDPYPLFGVGDGPAVP